MQTSNSKRIPAGIKVLALVLVLFLLGNMVLNYVLTPYSGSSYEMWRYYTEASPEMIYTGSSQCLCGIDPETMDAALGTVSYNMGTNMQSFRSAYCVIRAAVEEKGVKKVVLCVDDEITELVRNDNFRADASFQRARNATAGGFIACKESAEFLLDEPVLMHTGSINFFFPWTYDRVTGIGQNLREKRDGRIYGESGHRLSNGREPSDAILEPNFEAVKRENAKEWNEEAEALETLSLSDDSRKELKKIAAYCKENDVELVPITMPYPTALNLYSLASYKETVRDLTDLFASYGYDYRNFNLAKPSCYEMEITDYKDNGHLNTSGAVKFSNMLAEYLGKSIEQRNEEFYSWEEF